MQTVTQLDEHRRTKRRHPDRKRLHAVGLRFQELVPGLLDAFFSQADDFLFNLAEKGGTEANDYFDVLRVLRRKKSELRLNIIHGVRDWLEAGAQTLQPDDGGDVRHTTDYSKLSLMDDAELERTLAIDSFVTRTFERSGDDWLAFRERMMALTCEKQLKDVNTPYNPGPLGQIVLEQLETVDSPFKMTLMIFRLFDDMAIQRLVQFYHSTNIWLIEEGILPNLKLLQPQQSTQRTVDAQTIAQISAALAGNQTPYGAMPPTASMPMGYTQTGPGSVPAVSGSAGSYPMPTGSGTIGAGVSQFANTSGVMIDPALLQQIMSSMTQIQTMPAPAAHNLPELRNWTVKQAESVVKQAEGTLEAGTVSLVAMLFEYILDDESLSAHMKQLLARMQIPIIKVALLDKDFFTDTDHNARLLLNRMARAASGWRPDAHLENDPLLDGMEKIVTQLNHEFDDDLSIFENLLTEFDRLFANYRQQQKVQIDDIRVIEEKAFEEHLQQDRARLFMDTLLENEHLPLEVESLLNKYWYRLMKNIFTRQGDSKSWKTSARIARELVWSLQPSAQLTQSKRFNILVPRLLEGLTSGLKGIGMPAAEVDAALAAIREYHEQHKKPLNESVWDAQARLEQFKIQTEKAEALVEEPAPLPVDEPVVQTRSSDLSYYMNLVEELTTDQWFDIELSDGRMERGCLSMIIGDGSKYVFTDHTGEKIAERSAIGLAMSIRNEQFVLLAEEALVDRVIDTLVEELDHEAGV